MCIYNIRHRAAGRSGVTSAVESFIHSVSSMSFQVEPPASLFEVSSGGGTEFLANPSRMGCPILSDMGRLESDSERPQITDRLGSDSKRTRPTPFSPSPLPPSPVR